MNECRIEVQTKETWQRCQVSKTEGAKEHLTGSKISTQKGTRTEKLESVHAPTRSTFKNTVEKTLMEEKVDVFINAGILFWRRGRSRPAPAGAETARRGRVAIFGSHVDVCAAFSTPPVGAPAAALHISDRRVAA